MACGACAGLSAVRAGERGSSEREHGAERQAREGGQDGDERSDGRTCDEGADAVVDGTGEGDLKLVPELGVEGTGGRVVVTRVESGPKALEWVHTNA